MSDQSPSVDNVLTLPPDEGYLQVLASFLATGQSVEDYCAWSWREPAYFRTCLERVTEADLRAAQFIATEYLRGRALAGKETSAP